MNFIGWRSILSCSVSVALLLAPLNLKLDQKICTGKNASSYVEQALLTAPIWFFQSWASQVSAKTKNDVAHNMTPKTNRSRNVFSWVYDKLIIVPLKETILYVVIPLYLGGTPALVVFQIVFWCRHYVNLQPIETSNNKGMWINYLVPTALTLITMGLVVIDRSDESDISTIALKTHILLNAVGGLFRGVFGINIGLGHIEDASDHSLGLRVTTRQLKAPQQNIVVKDMSIARLEDQLIQVSDRLPVDQREIKRIVHELEALNHHLQPQTNVRVCQFLAAHYKLHRDLNKAKIYSLAECQLQPNNFKALLLLLGICTKLHDWPTIITHAVVFLDTQTLTEEDHLKLEDFLIAALTNSDDLAAAQKRAEALLEVYPGSITPHKYLSEIFFKRRQNAQALDHALYVYDKDKNDWRTIILLGKIYWHLEKYNDAAKVLEPYINYHTRAKNDFLALECFISALWHAGRRYEAKKWLRKGEEYAESVHRPRANLLGMQADFLIQELSEYSYDTSTQKVLQAVGLAEKAYELSPTAPHLRILSKAYMLEGKTLKALNAIKLAFNRSANASASTLKQYFHVLFVRREFDEILNLIDQIQQSIPLKEKVLEAVLAIHNQILAEISSVSDSTSLRSRILQQRA